MYFHKINLKWFRDSAGYDLTDYGKYGSRIIGKGGKLIPFSPFESNDAAFSAFASVTSATSLLSFVERYGLLDNAAYGVPVDQDREMEIVLGGSLLTMDERGVSLGNDTPDGEDVGHHLNTAQLFHEILEQSGKGWRRIRPTLAESIATALAGKPLGRISLAGDRQYGFQMVLTARSLMDGLWLQLSQKVAGQAEFTKCNLPSCGRIFEVGSSSGRRLDARFCSDSHRIRFNSYKRTKGP